MRRLILFDVDGTLVWGGPAPKAFTVALVEVFGTSGPVERVSFAGKTDPQIARELLRGAGLDDDRISSGLPELWPRYTRELARRLPGSPVTPLPGVRALVGALAATRAAAVGLVTGNIREGARLKLESAGLVGGEAGRTRGRTSRTALLEVGAYGSDHEHRNRLPAIAVERAERVFGVDFPPESVVVVGDTPLDVECGHRHGARTFAVATGHFSAAELRAAGADRVAADLVATEDVLGVLLG